MANKRKVVFLSCYLLLLDYRAIRSSCSLPSESTMIKAVYIRPIPGPTVSLIITTKLSSIVKRSFLSLQAGCYRFPQLRPTCVQLTKTSW